MKKIVSGCIVIAVSSMLFCQEALKSTEEEYYDFLALEGLVTRPTLNYRTLSDSEWNLSDEAEADSRNVWKDNSLGTKQKITDHISFKAYGPDWYNSYNTAAPYGQNDGALWQGKGYNTSITAGGRLEAYGFELTLKPQLSFSQNLSYDYLIDSNMTGTSYTGKAATYGYVWGTVDAPQRFGDSSFATFDWGDTELRYTWHTLTAGIGTQAIWLGPAWLNPVLSSNNAATYPKVDFGIRKTAVTIPGINWYIGDFEFREWLGYLSESDYFDNDSSNDHNMINAFSFSYAPSFIPGMTLGINRVFLTKWSKENLKYIKSLYSTSNSNTVEDQKASFTMDWLFPPVGFEAYGEIGIDDFSPDSDAWIYRTMVYTVGLKKNISISKARNIYGEIIFEWNNMEMTQDFQFDWAYSFYFHSVVTQGYTNRGQYIGAGSGSGGITQYLGFKLYYSKGSTLLFIHHSNPDDNYLYAKTVNTTLSREVRDVYLRSFKSILTYGISTNYFLTPEIQISAGMAYATIVHPKYDMNSTIHNITLTLGIKYNFR